MKGQIMTISAQETADSVREAAKSHHRLIRPQKSSVKEYTAVYVIGALGYSLVEIIWRGNTHWTMTLTGGLCFVLIYATNLKNHFKKLWKKCLMGSGIITSVEFSVGCLVNLGLKWNVWDYSAMHFNILGQICLLYSGLWFLLCIPLSKLTTFLHKTLREKFA